jgi:hypothetical protein
LRDWRREPSLHDRFAQRAAAVTGDLTDIVGNIAWYGLADATRKRGCRVASSTGGAQCDSLRSLERVKLRTWVVFR